MAPTLLGLDRGKPLPRALIFIPVLTLIVLCVLWITISVRLHIEKVAVLRETEEAAQTLARSLRSFLTPGFSSCRENRAHCLHSMHNSLRNSGPNMALWLS